MSVFIGDKAKRVELAERKDAINPNLLEKSKAFIMYTPWGTVKCGNTIHCTKGTKSTGSIYLSSDPNNPGLKKNATAYFSCEPNTYYTESLWITSSVALNGVESSIAFQDSSYTNATTIGAKTINLGNNHYKIVGSFYSGTNMANFDIGYIKGFNNFISADADISFDVLKIEKGTTATDWCPDTEDIAWKSDITSLQNQINQQNQAIQSLTTRLTNAENEISYIKANYIEGKQFPASQEAQATAWEQANPQRIAFITSN